MSVMQAVMADQLSEQAQYTDPMQVSQSVRIAASRQSSKLDQAYSTNAKVKSTAEDASSAPQTNGIDETLQPVPYVPQNSNVDPKLISTFTMPQQRVNVGHKQLALKFKVLYLGCSKLEENAKTDIEGLQRYIRNRYSTRGELHGVETYITSYSSGMQMQHLDDPSSVTWFPIRLLHSCAAVRYEPATRRSREHGRFRSLDDPKEVNTPSNHPPLFVCVLEREMADKSIAKDCHIFMCSEAAVVRTWVANCTIAYQNKSWWTDDMPPIVVTARPQPRPTKPSNIWLPMTGTIPRMGTMPPGMMMGPRPPMMPMLPGPRFTLPPPPSTVSGSSYSTESSSAYSSSSYESEYDYNKNSEFYSKHNWQRNRSFDEHGPSHSRRRSYSPRQHRRQRSYSPRYRRRRSVSPPRGRRSPPLQHQGRSPVRRAPPRRQHSPPDRRPMKVANEPVYAKTIKRDTPKPNQQKEFNRNVSVPMKSQNIQREDERSEDFVPFLDDDLPTSRQPTSRQPTSRQLTRMATKVEPTYNREPTRMATKVEPTYNREPPRRKPSYQKETPTFEPLFDDELPGPSRQSSAMIRQSTQGNRYSPLLDDRVVEKKKSPRDNNWSFEPKKNTVVSESSGGVYGDAQAYTRHIDSIEVTQNRMKIPYQPNKETLHQLNKETLHERRTRTPSPDYSVSDRGHPARAMLHDNQIYNTNGINGQRNTQRRNSSQHSDYSSEYGVNHDYEHQWPPYPTTDPINEYINRNPGNSYGQENRAPRQQDQTHMTHNPLFYDGEGLPTFQKRRPDLNGVGMAPNKSPVLGGRSRGLPRHDDRVREQHLADVLDRGPDIVSGYRSMSPPRHNNRNQGYNTYDDVNNHVPLTGFLEKKHRRSGKHKQKMNGHYEDADLYNQRNGQFNGFGQGMAGSLGRMPGSMTHQNGYNSGNPKHDPHQQKRGGNKFGKLAAGAKKLGGRIPNGVKEAGAGMMGDVGGEMIGGFAGDMMGDAAGDFIGGAAGNMIGEMGGELLGNVAGEFLGEGLGGAVGKLGGKLGGKLFGGQKNKGGGLGSRDMNMQNVVAAKAPLMDELRMRQKKKNRLY